ncbi:hypothetical protein [Antrihabitans sp. YC2-6]|uniref:hypothetical protein n=1 Tax=Antrihabitans sp. YC2-6 TaxID=2799498 RepID=UPI0018F7ACEE|nr:hypothetical protein [Antrihabitans sp. YC2-6]MBJ8344832.1 hypothetical protein [Antrihabitans sp. YC2-6]
MTIYADALNAIPQYNDAQRAIATINTWRLEITTVPTRDALDQQLVTELVDAAATGKPQPADLVARLHTHQQEARMYGEHVQLLNRAADYANDLNRMVIQNGIEYAYSHLQRVLDEVLKDVRANTAALRDVRSAEEAIASSAIDGWTNVQQLVGRYDELRKAHRDIARIEAGSAVDSHKFAVVGQLADHLDRDPFWIQRRTFAAANCRLPGNDGGASTSTMPHGVPVQASTLTDRASYLRWLRAAKSIAPAPDKARPSEIWPNGVARARWLLHIATKCEPWIATAEQIDVAYDTAYNATSAVQDEYGRRHFTDALKRHQAITQTQAVTQTRVAVGT